MNQEPEFTLRAVLVQLATLLFLALLAVAVCVAVFSLGGLKP